MKVPHADVLIVLVAAAVSVNTASRVRAVLAIAPADSAMNVVARPAEVELPRLTLSAMPPTSDDSTDYAQFVIDNDLFRLANAPSPLRYAPGSGGVVNVSIAVARPQLAVRAIIGGPPWQAMLDGAPGGQTIVRNGQVVGALTVRSVGRDTVIVQGMDTTWKLTLHGSRP